MLSGDKISCRLKSDSRLESEAAAGAISQALFARLSTHDSLPPDRVSQGFPTYISCAQK